MYTDNAPPFEGNLNFPIIFLNISDFSARVRGGGVFVEKSPLCQIGPDPCIEVSRDGARLHY